MLKLEHITKTYTAGNTQVQALKGIDLEFRRSEFVAVLGHSGCGKTTLLNIIGGLDQYTSGDLIINGKSTKDFTAGDWDTYRNHSVGFVFQTYNLIPHQSVLSNVELALTLSGVSKAQRRARAKAALESVGLGDQLHKRPNQMSGGQMQRVAIARALVNDPDILLADEPTGALDSDTSVQVMEILKEISRDRLVVMVTHNPELADNYATRIVRVRDGLVISDSDPYEAAETVPDQAAARKPSMHFPTALGLSLNNLLTKKGRTLLTAFAGSIGIIGIALILSLSNGIQLYIDRVQEDTLSSYPITLEAEVLDMSGMVTALMGARADQAKDTGEARERDEVYSNTILYDLMNSLTQTESLTNDLGSFKTWMEQQDTGLADHISAVQYSYDLDMDIYTLDTEGKIFRSDIMELMQSSMSSLYGGDYSSYFERYGSAYSRMEVWEELLAPADEADGALVDPLLSEQYDMVYGHWPENYDEAVLFITENNEISDLVIYCMGLSSQDQVSESMQRMMNGEENEAFAEHWSYDQLCGKSFKVILPGEYWQYDPSSGGYTDLSATEAGMDYLYNSDEAGTRVTIVGIARPNGDAASTMVTGSIGYTAALTRHLMDLTGSLEVLTAQKETPDIDVLLNLPFRTEDYTVSDEQKREAVIAYLTDLPVGEKADIYRALTGTPTEDFLDTMTQQQLEGVTREFIEQQVADSYALQMGVDPAAVQGYISQMDDDTLFSLVESAMREQLAAQYAASAEMELSTLTNEQLAALLDQSFAAETEENALTQEQVDWLYDEYVPSAVSESTYADNLKKLGDADETSLKSISIYVSTFADKDAVTSAIDEYNAGAEEEQRIEYTDYMALLMSSITTIINAISYVLIAYVAISLVVSSIMIGVITYISVLERTKEIGILRAIGASRRDISRVFNAETLIVGFCSGVIGILLSLLFLIPINLIVHRLTGIASLNAVLPASAAAILVGISMLLTFIAGLIPSGIAARKDPVEALRTE